MVLIREMEEKDKQEVLDMMRVFYDSPAVFHTSSDAVLKRDVEDCLGELPFVEGFVFADGEELAGYAIISKGYTTEYGGLCIWIEDLFIKPRYRRRGIASAWFGYLEKRCPDAVRFKLEVEKENTGAIETYRRCGYGGSPYFEMTKEMGEG